VAEENNEARVFAQARGKRTASGGLGELRCCQDGSQLAVNWQLNQPKDTCD
jgi:hypothetical protein